MRAGEITVRRVDPLVERARILAVLRRNLPTAATPERFEWLYLSNPDGPALVWLAQDHDGVPVGTSAAHPRRMRLDGSLIRVLNLGDFAVDADRRILGPALQLLRATLEPVSASAFALSYDFPSRQMLALYQRMGLAELARSERWVRPITLAPAVQRRLGDGTLSAVVGAAADAALRIRDGLTRNSTAVQVDELTTECGEEFDALEAGLGAAGMIRGVRDSAYLNWRYLRHTMWRHTVLCARTNGLLVGYAVLRHGEAPVVSLMDLQPHNDEGICRSLVNDALQWARDRGASSLEVEVVHGSASAGMVQALHFVRRETHVGPVAFVPPLSPHAAQLAAPNNWWLMGGDRDI